MVSGGYSLVALPGLPIAVASLVKHVLSDVRTSAVAAHGLNSVSSGLQSTGSIVVAHGLSCSTEGGIFLDWESNPCLLHWRRILYH